MKVRGWELSGGHADRLAERLSMSHPTIKFDVSIVLSKLGVSSRTEAVALALQHNLVT